MNKYKGFIQIDGDFFNFIKIKKVLKSIFIVKISHNKLEY